MILTAVLVLVLLSVPLAGGRFSRMADVRWRLPLLALAALVMQVVVIEVVPGGNSWVHRAVHLASYVLLLGFAVLNLSRVKWLWLITLGGAMNGLAIAANGGVMPARPGALRSAGIEQNPDEFINSTVVDGARLSWLGDVFAVPASWPVPGVFSIGDVLLVLGVTLCLHAICGRRTAPALAPA